MKIKASLIGLTALLGGSLSPYTGASTVQGPMQDNRMERCLELVQGRPARYKADYVVLVEIAARSHGVPPEVAHRLIETESGWRANARGDYVRGVGHKAVGLAQLWPDTAWEMSGYEDTERGRKMAAKNRWNPHISACWGVGYLAKQHARWGDWALAGVAYRGPGIARRANYVATGEGR